MSTASNKTAQAFARASVVEPHRSVRPGLDLERYNAQDATTRAAVRDAYLAGDRGDLLPDLCEHFAFLDRCEADAARARRRKERAEERKAVRQAARETLEPKDRQAARDFQIDLFDLPTVATPVL